MKLFRRYKTWMFTAFVAAALTCTPAFAAKQSKVAEDDDMSGLIEMSDQLDEIDSQDFHGAIERATSCTRMRDFTCAEAELTKAEKSANGGKDKKILLASRQRLADERLELANEIRRAEEARRREEEERQARIRREEQAEQERQARIRKEREEAEAEDEMSPSEYAAMLIEQGNQKHAKDMEMLRNFNRQTVAAYAETNRRLAEQAAERKRAREEQEEREADRRREARRNEEARQSRERAAREEAERAARARTVAAQQELPKYQPQVVTIPRVKSECPPGYTWSPPTYDRETQKGLSVPTCTKNSQAQGQVASNASSGSDRQPSGTTTRTQTTDLSGGNTHSGPSGSTKKIEWGPIQLEALAICHKSPKNGKWRCMGALDNEILYDSPTLESSLGRQHCAGGTWAAGGPTYDGVQWDAYRCGHSLGAGDNDITKRFAMTTARNSYICPKYQLGDGRCTTIYDGQDKR